MTLLDDIAVAKFPKMGCTYRLRLDGQPAIKHMANGSKVTIPTVIFYDDQLPPRVLASRPISIWMEALGDLEQVLERYGQPEYGQLYCVKVLPRYPGAKSAITFEMQVLESHRLLEYFRDAPEPAPPTAAAAPAPTAGPTAAAATGPTAAAEGRGCASAAGSTTPPTCRQCGQPATWFDGKYVHCGREVGS